MYQTDRIVLGKGSLCGQIESILRHRIHSGTYAPGSPFPTDADLCAEFGVSRATVRVALDALRRDGLIVRYPRRGSFVKERGNDAFALRFNGSIEQIITQGDGAGTAHHIERCQYAAPTAIEREQLQLGPDDKVLRISGYRVRDGVRVGQMQVSMPAELGKHLNIKEGGEYATIFRLFEERLGLKTHRVRQSVTAAMPSRDTAQALGISPRVPLLVRQRTFLGADGQPLQLAVASFPSDRYRYEIEIS
ncbi:GntR family transcriptional regulator [Pigmentiphaga soli]|uniref:GntR family transcriptional regulator n=1 Tax=Pigmentiphaga soli TaxID=1007095 RepID=A0ABP8HE96_9BURK